MNLSVQQTIRVPFHTPLFLPGAPARLSNKEDWGGLEKKEKQESETVSRKKTRKKEQDSHP